jgi:hypothetical protein
VEIYLFDLTSTIFVKPYNFLTIDQQMNDVEPSDNGIDVRTACDALEYALRSPQPILMAQVEKNNKHSLLQKIVAITGKF